MSVSPVLQNLNPITITPSPFDVHQATQSLEGIFKPNGFLSSFSEDSFFYLLNSQSDSLKLNNLSWLNTTTQALSSLFDKLGLISQDLSRSQFQLSNNENLLNNSLALENLPISKLDSYTLRTELMKLLKDDEVNHFGGYSLAERLDQSCNNLASSIASKISDSFDAAKTEINKFIYQEPSQAHQNQAQVPYLKQCTTYEQNLPQQAAYSTRSTQYYNEPKPQPYEYKKKEKNETNNKQNIEGGLHKLKQIINQFISFIQSIIHIN